jgi:ribosomal protein L16 Arg81 hydroxylase
MTLALSIGLTLITLCSILIIIVKKRKKYFAKLVYTQSSIHQIVKSFLPKDLFEVPKMLSQSRKHVRNNTVKVLIIEDSAYWVHNNMFYVADAVDGAVDSETVRPVDTNNMSKRDIDKMLFILDSLKNGNSDDSSSTWNG